MSIVYFPATGLISKHLKQTTASKQPKEQMMGAIPMPKLLALATAPTNTTTTSTTNDDFLPRKTSSTNHSSTSYHLSLPKPSLLVRTQSNVRIERRRKPEPSCVVCDGSGRVDCHHCQGRGRTNYTDLLMLPRGEWPKWCKTCGGSGLGYCSRCLGTGEYRDVMGFHFMKRESNDPPKQTTPQVEENAEVLTPADMLFSPTLSEAEQ